MLGDQPARSRHCLRRERIGALGPSGRRLRPCRTSTPRRRGPSTTGTRSAPGSTHRASPSPRRPMPGPRPCSTGRSTGSHSRPPGACTSQPRTTRFMRWPPTRAPSCGRATSGPRSRQATCLAATSARRSASPARPVLDVARGEIFAVADEFSGSTPAHVLVGLNMYTGTTMLDEEVDPARSAHVGDPAADRLEPQQRERGVRATGATTGTARPTAAGSPRRPRAAGRRVITRRCRSATTGPCGWEAPPRGRWGGEHLGRHGERVVVDSL